MKFAAICLIAFVAAVSAAPTQITDNNVGDIVSVNVDADVSIDNKIDVNIIKLLLKYMNEQKLSVNAGGYNDYYKGAAAAPAQPQFQITPEMMAMAQKFLSQQ